MPILHSLGGCAGRVSAEGRQNAVGLDEPQCSYLFSLCITKSQSCFDLSTSTMVAGWARTDVGHRRDLAREVVPYTTTKSRLPLFELKT